MGKHLDKVIELEYKQFINDHTKKLDSTQAVIFKQGLREDLKREIKEEILDDVTKEVEKSFEIRYEHKKVENIKTLTWVGVILSFFVGLAVNQCTECLVLWKHRYPGYEPTLTIILFLASICFILVILLCVILKTISNTFSTKESGKTKKPPVTGGVMKQ